LAVAASAASASPAISSSLCSDDLCVESKVRANGFRQLYAWLQGRDVLVVRSDRREPLVVVPLSLAIQVAKAAERGRK
jgi:hypothetical protein